MIESVLFCILQLFHNTPNRSNQEKCRYLTSGSRNISESSNVASQNFPDLIYQTLKTILIFLCEIRQSTENSTKALDTEAAY